MNFPSHADAICVLERLNLENVYFCDFNKRTFEVSKGHKISRSIIQETRGLSKTPTPTFEVSPNVLTQSALSLKMKDQKTGEVS